MTINYVSHFNLKETPQTQPIPGKEMEKNNAGGYSFAITKWDQMLRFLILGTEGGTYYSKENTLTQENAKNTIECIQENTEKALQLILDISLDGRAAKQDATIFALALACTFAEEKKKPLAYLAINKVCRTGTHLFTFTNYVQALRGWSRGLRTGVGKFYTAKPLEALELQIVKYRNRQGFTHKDVIRLSHPGTTSPERNLLFKYAVGKITPEENTSFLEKFKLINAYENAKLLNAKDKNDIKKMIDLISQNNLPREAIPTEFLNSEEVWQSLLPGMPINALIRSLGKISSLNITKSNLATATTQILEKLTNQESITKSRIHPLQILTALKVYQTGHGEKGSLAWSPNGRIIDALNQAFYSSFKNVEPTGKNILLALDVSGSMGANFTAGSSVLDCRTAAAAMAMVTAKVENNWDIIGFTNAGKSYFEREKGTGRWNSTGVSQLAITPNQRLDDIVKYMQGLPFGGTDCALPMEYAEKNKIVVDTFVIYTDNETYAGKVHPKQALDSYRQKTGINAKLAVVAMTPTRFSIADPSDAGMMDVVGFDTSTPNIISEFSKGFSL
jgi:60 kDa SS-A/Ro ribonucleoprotein